MRYGTATLGSLVVGVVFLTSGSGSAQVLEYGRDPSPVVDLGSGRAGASAAHVLSFNVFKGELETYRALVTYPPEFRFNGFQTLGPPGSQVGALMLDFDGDGTADHTVPLRSVTASLAYADVVADGEFSPELEPTLAHGAGTFRLHLPFGGDANRQTVAAVADARVSLVLLPGLITNPERAGTYVVMAELLSVDPDTGGPDDGAGASPLTLAFELSVAIQATSPELVAALCIDTARLHEGFTVHGRFQLDTGSDGIDLARDRVTVLLGSFQQEIPGTAFTAVGAALARFEHDGPGITRLELGPKGTFRIEARGVDLGGAGEEQTMAFALVIGDDRGETLLTFDRRGHLRDHRPCPP